MQKIRISGLFKTASEPELFTNPFFTVNTGRHKKLSFAAVFSYKQNNQKFICQRLKRVNNAGESRGKYILIQFWFFQKQTQNLITCPPNSCG
jgi:hypothetical protein